VKKFVLLFSLLVLLPSLTFSQDFIPGYYIIESDAKYAVVLPSSLDFFPDTFGCMQQYEDLIMKAGEVVVSFEQSKGRYYCFDPNGRMVVFQCDNCLTKAPMLSGAGVGHMEETIELIDGSSIDSGAYYWIISQNTANSTVKIQITNGKTYDIPQNKIRLYGAHIKNLMNIMNFTNVEN
jgi:hypothetical protein